VGDSVGLRVGFNEGMAVGLKEGARVGISVGTSVGLEVILTEEYSIYNDNTLLRRNHVKFFILI
jgi:hypothetical protein